MPSWRARAPSVAGRSPTITRTSPAGTRASMASRGRAVGLARDLGCRLGGGRHGSQQGTSAGHETVRSREGRVLVRPDQAGAVPDGRGGASDAVEGELASPADDDGVGWPFWHHRHPVACECLDDPVAAQHQRCRARRRACRRQRRRRSEVGVVRGDPAVLQAEVELGPRRCGVVGGEQHPHAGVAQQGDSIGAARDRPPVQPHHAVEVDDPRSPRRRRPHGCRGYLGPVLDLRSAGDDGARGTRHRGPGRRQTWTCTLRTAIYGGRSRTGSRPAPVDRSAGGGGVFLSLAGGTRGCQ